MTTPTIPFRESFREALLSGRKTATSRTSQYGEQGRQFQAFGVLFEFTFVERRLLAEIASHHYKAEGCASPDEFIRVWNEIHPRKRFDPLTVVWYHEFKLVS